MKKFILIGFFILLFQFGFSQKIDDVSYIRDGNQIRISYSIKDAKYYQKFFVSIYLSVDKGQNFVGPLSFVSGDVGENIYTGKNKVVYWDVFKEFDGLKGDIVFDIRAKVSETIEDKYFVLYQANNITPYGLKIGNIDLFGWYVSFFTNTNYNLYNYELKNDFIQDFPIDKYYVVTGDIKYHRYSVVAGMNYMLFRNTYFNFGLGYGYKEQIGQLKEYSYSEGIYLATSYFKNTSESYSGLELETGLMYKWNNILFSGGINTLRFKRIDWNLGVGYCF